ncbi:DMT family transporter [Sabulicella glaciei]|uniref:DMT family transporter n=1 Tax=Sabulicella glaciei TaxID=2984948 RepID=A0ABT3NW53_9PROT|nr:DMT family transporter [Roseococcus sp. MDT2-1-1]
MTQRSTGLVFLLICALGWGSNWPVVKVLLAEMPPMATRGWAGLAAASCFALGARAFGISLNVPRAQRPRLVLYSILNVASWMGFVTFALLWLKASEGVILGSTAPVIAVLLAWLILGERPGWPRLLGLALAVGSIAVLFAGRGAEFSLEKLPGLGLMLCATTLFALATVLAKRRPLSLHPVAVTTWQLAIGMTPLLLYSILFEEVAWSALDMRAWVFLGWMAAVPLGLAYLGWFGALQRLPATTCTMGTLLVPVVGVLGGALVLDEPLGWREAVALLGTIGGVALALRAGEKRA